MGPQLKQENQMLVWGRVQQPRGSAVYFTVSLSAICDGSGEAVELGNACQAHLI